MSDPVFSKEASGAGRTLAWRGRLFLWGAWSVPAVLTIPGAGSPADACIEALTVGALAGVVAFVPRALWRLLCVASLLCLPFTLWWCGYAAVAGGGPGYEPVIAALRTNVGEASGAARLALQNPLLPLVVLAHIGLLAAASWEALRCRSRAAAAEDRRALGALACCLLAMWPVARWASEESAAPPRSQRMPGNTPFTYERHVRPHPIFGRASFASPLGSLEEILTVRSRSAAALSASGYQRAAPAPVPPVTRATVAVFFLGESARAEAYGPGTGERGPASAALAQRIGAGLGAWLPRTCAASDGTHLAVPVLLTGASPGEFAAARRRPTLLARLHAAGFATAWLANNQGGPDATERGHDLYAGVFNVNPDDLYGAHLSGWKYDSDMLPEAQAFIGAHSGSAALLLHGIGSHFPYEARYPQAAFPPEPPGLDSDQRLELRYERSLEFEAAVLLRLAAFLDSLGRPAFLLYTSDHGESLPRDRDGLRGHLAARTARAVAYVPAFVLWNEAMRASGRPDTVLARLRAAPEIAHGDVGRAFLALAGLPATAIAPTAVPEIWARRRMGEDYALIPCEEMEP